MDILEGKVAVVTGSTRGLGLAIARAYAREGAVVVICSRSAESVERTVRALQGDGLRVSGLATDVGNLADVQALARHALDTWGRLDIWVNNAGLAGISGPTAHIAAEESARVLRTNILGVFYGSWVALQHFLPQGRGKLINVLGMGDRRPGPLQNAYASSKAWVRSFTLALAAEYRDSGVGIFAFHPGLMRTDLVQKVVAVSGYEGRMKVLETIIRMWANDPEVPARRALWVASAATDGRTGLEVRVSSTWHLLGGALRELWRRIMRRPAPPAVVAVSTVPGILPSLPAGGAGHTS